MCGIIGYTGIRKALPMLLEGLAALEYRGYDSAGVAYFADGVIKAVKSGGRLRNLSGKLCSLDTDTVTCGIGHTRWATHGEASDRNSHPHGNERVYAVHNGIVENFGEISDYLTGIGYTFTSDTDTERAVLLIDHIYRKTGDPIIALTEVQKHLKGSYAMAIVFGDYPEAIYAMRRESPLLVSPSDTGYFLESDISAVLRYTDSFVRLEEGEIALLTKDTAKFYDSDGVQINKAYEKATWDIEAAERGGYPHFMLKEIFEEGEAIRKTLRTRIKDSLPNIGIKSDTFKNVGTIHITACGTAMHAGLIGKIAIEKLARIQVNVEIASEFRYKDPILGENDLVIVISQSGETADSLAALRLAKTRGISTLAIVNVPGSTIAREADSTLYTWAGPEIAVASTKAYSVQIALLYLIATEAALEKGAVRTEDAMKLCDELSGINKRIEMTYRLADTCRNLAERYKDHESIFFIGRGHDYALSMEAALKMKEISYIHCEAYAAGELKHGTISLIDKGTPVIAFATRQSVYDKMLSNIKEVKARGADVLLLVPEGTEVADGTADERVFIPKVSDIFMPLTTVTVAQLLAYYVAVARGCDVDKPRNLAKSVTVE